MDNQGLLILCHKYTLYTSFTLTPTVSTLFQVLIIVHVNPKIASYLFLFPG